MSKVVWVKWHDAADKADYCAKVYYLEADADVADLCSALVQQQRLNVASAKLSVRESERGPILKGSTPLKPYFAAPPGSVAAPTPGNTYDTPLLASFPPPPQTENRIESLLEHIKQGQDEVKQGQETVKKMLEEAATECVPMSAATLGFVKGVLQAMNITFVVRPPNHEPGDGPMEEYQWGDTEKEESGQPHCKLILEKEILPLDVSGEAFGLFDARGLPLPQVEIGKRKSNGFSDLALGPTGAMELSLSTARDLVLFHVVALVELKTENAEMKQGQLLLQLLSLSAVSTTRQGVVVLGTDCAKKWRLLHFDAYKNIVVQQYTHGKKCIADFKSLIAESPTRMQQNHAPSKTGSMMEEDIDQDLDMTDFGVEPTARDQAIEREAELRKLADAIGSYFGETLEVPFWATAEATCPSYYS